MASSRNENQLEAFGTKLFSTVSQKNTTENIFLSPASIALAMSMCTVGARENTLQQMLKTLQVSSTDELEKRAGELMSIFKCVSTDSKVALHLANRLYAQKAYRLRDEYLTTIQDSFSADIQLADFANEGSKVAATINAWVEEQTKNLIKNLLQPNDIAADTRLVIINCIYFKGVWVKPFEERLTIRDALFYEADGKTSKVELMYVKHKFSYGEYRDLGVQIVDLPYKSEKLSAKFVFTVILPVNGVSLNEIEQKFNNDPELLGRVLDADRSTHQDILTYLPKFKMEATLNLNEVLENMGMIDAFDSHSANFTGIVNPQDDANGLVISKVIHKAFIDVNEQGSEAAAATAVVMVKCAMAIRKTDPIVFRADRPFLFYIREVYSKSKLFSGKFSKRA